MTDRGAFALAIRIGGGWEVLKSMDYLYYVSVKLLGLPTRSEVPVQIDVDTFLFDFLVGMALILLADPIALLIWRPKSKRIE